MHGSRTRHTLPPKKSIAPPEPESDDDSTASDANPPRSTAPSSFTLGGKQARPDSGYSMEVRAAMDDCWGSSAGNRKTSQTRSRRRARPRRGRKLRRTIARFSTTARRIFPSPRRDCTSHGRRGRRRAGGRGSGTEHRRIFSYAAWADKFDGAVHNPPFRNIAIAMNEAIGTMASSVREKRRCLVFFRSRCPRSPWAIRDCCSIGGVSADHGDLYQLFDTSDLPGGAT